MKDIFKTISSLENLLSAWQEFLRGKRGRKDVQVDSYSCQIGKGTHKALDKFRKFAYKMSKNNTRTCYVLKGDI